MHCHNPRFQAAFTLIELLIAIIVVVTLTAIALPSYQSHITKAKQAQAISDIAKISMAIESFRSLNNAYPADLAALAGAGMTITHAHGHIRKFHAAARRRNWLVLRADRDCPAGTSGLSLLV